MAITALWLKIEEERFVQALQDAWGKLDSVEAEMVLDFSSVHRIDSSALSVMEEFVSMGDGKGVKVVLHGVRVGVYKVLKLTKLASRFSFES
jgi:anti-anti-sigma regulatory factor